MKDPRIEIMAKNLLHYSVNLQSGENILIELQDDGEDLAAALIKEAYAIGANPYLTVKNRALMRELLRGCNEKQIALVAEVEAERMRNMQAYIGIRGTKNSADWSDVPGEKMSIYQRHWFKKVHSEIRVPSTKWCVMRYPNPSMSSMYAPLIMQKWARLWSH